MIFTHRNCCLYPSVLLLSIVLLASGCARRAPVVPEAGGRVGHGQGYLINSEIEGQLNDGGWVLNIPGEAHTHRVVLTECPETPVVVTHVHNHLQAAQVGKGGHKHRGCYICPPKNSLVQRILTH